MNGLRAPLLEVSSAVDAVIASDDFPESVRPDFLGRAVRDYPSRGGKRLRPALLAWSCGLLGGDISKAWLPAAALEIWHNWTLVHDDIIDQDPLRRGVPTEHRRLIGTVTAAPFRVSGPEAERQGTNLAMLCGDLQQVWANRLLLRAQRQGLRSEIVLSALNRMQELGGRELISGEAMDVTLSMIPVHEVDIDEVLAMYRMKTGSLLRLASELGAMIALDDPAADRDETRSLGEFAELCGVAFQLRDDYLGIFADDAELGKSAASDLKECKPTVLLLRTLALISPELRPELLSCLRLSDYPQDTMTRIRKWMRECGAADDVTERCRSLTGRARKILQRFPAGRYRDYLSAFAEYCGM